MELARRLTLVDAIAIVVGIMIGGGIFLVPNLVARSLPSVAMITTVWIAAGAISLLGGTGMRRVGRSVSFNRRAVCVPS